MKKLIKTETGSKFGDNFKKHAKNVTDGVTQYENRNKTNPDKGKLNCD